METDPCERINRQFDSALDCPSVRLVGGDNGESAKDAWHYLRTGADTDAQLFEESSVERERQQIALIEWAKLRNRLVAEATILSIPILSNSTSEHEVRYRAFDEWVTKITWPGVYGQVPVIRSGKLDRALASPAQYIARIVLHNLVFRGKIELLGVHVSDRPSLVIGEKPGQPSLVVLQPWYLAADLRNPSPASEAVSDFMQVQGFSSVHGSYFGWVRPTDGLVIVDAKPDNFILTAQGIVPIDLQMAQYEPAILHQNGLVAGASENEKPTIILARK